MASNAIDYDRRSAPDNWRTVSYTVRRPGHRAWETGIKTLGEARESRARANMTVCNEHYIYAEQEYIGELESLKGTTRTVAV